MKQTLSLLAALLCLTLLVGCSRSEPPAAEPEPEPPRVLTYSIDRSELSGGLPIEMYFEIPIFEGESDAAFRINRALSAVRWSYIDYNAEEVWKMVRASMGGEYGPTAESPYIDTHTAAVRTCDEKLISVAIAYNWYMGGVNDYGVDTYNFDARDGSPLRLNDLLSGTDNEIKESIITALLEQYPGVKFTGVLESPLSVIRGKSMDSFRFYVENGAVHVCFNKYEISYGAAGAFDVSLPDALMI